MGGCNDRRAYRQANKAVPRAARADAGAVRRKDRTYGQLYFDRRAGRVVPALREADNDNKRARNLRRRYILRRGRPLGRLSRITAVEAAGGAVTGRAEEDIGDIGSDDTTARSRKPKLDT